MPAPVVDNPRYLNYARCQGRTPAAQLEHDRNMWPGGLMVGFIIWNHARLQEFHRSHPAAFMDKHLYNHTAYDAWLDVWVPLPVGGEGDRLCPSV